MSVKRTLDEASQAQPPAKRSAPTPSSSLNTWLSVKAPSAPTVLVNSPPLTDRKSTFVAHATFAKNEHQAKQFHSFVRALRAPNHPTPADHEILGWRTMGLRLGKDGMKEEDWIVKSGGDDDDEKGGSNTVRKCLEEEASVDVAVVVSRYWGGVMLGPDRFNHMRTVTKQALELLAAQQLVTKLQELDREIDSLILSPILFSPGQKVPAPPNYEGMTVLKAERLLKAKEKRRDFLLSEINKRETGQKEEEGKENEEREEEEKGKEEKEEENEEGESSGGA
ncbi:ribosomal protein S5 domain 2-like protein [Meredithblackwellia eburnea MCA 4105]